jgi:RecB family exonuclease
MKRTVLNSLDIPAGSLAGRICLTPHQQAARALGVTVRTLESEAAGILREAGWELASPLVQERMLEQAVATVTGGLEGHGKGSWVMARHLQPTVGVVLRGGVDRSRLVGDEVARIQQLGRVVENYRARLERLALVDPAESLWAAARLAPPRRPLLVYGYFQPRRDELTLLDALAGDGSILVLPNLEGGLFEANREGLRFLVEQGWETRPATGVGVSGDEWAGRGGAVVSRFLTGDGAGEVVGRSWPTVEAEVRGVLGEVREWLARGVAPAEIVLLTSDEEGYRPAVEAVGWEYGLPVRAARVRPLSTHRLGSWVKQLLEMVESDYDYEPTLRFLGHALSAGLQPEALNWSTIRWREWRGVGLDPVLTGWPVAGAGATLAALTTRLLAALARTPGLANDLVNDDPGRLLREGLAELVRIDGDGEVTIAEFARTVNARLGQLMVPELEPVEGVELQHPEAVVGGRYRHVFLLGMIEGEVPRPLSEDVILDFHERRRLGQRGVRLESAVEMVRRETLTLLLAIATASETVSFSRPRMKAGRMTLPSDLLRRLGVAPLAVGGHAAPSGWPPVSIEEVRRESLRRRIAGEVGFEPELETDGAPGRIARAWQVEMAREVAANQDEFDGVTGLGVDAAHRIWSASQLTRFGQCAFTWFSRDLLGINEEAELPAEMTPRLRGDLFHRALELALGGVPADGDPRQHALAVIDRCLRQAEEDPQYPLPRYPAWEAQRAELLGTLRTAIRAEQFIAPGAIVIGCERQFRGDWFGLRVKGYIDRIDQTPDGIELIDYKTSGKFPRGVQDETGVLRLDLQIPIYVDVAGRSLFPEQTVRGRYYSLNRGKTLTQRAPAGDGQLAGFAARVRDQLREGAFPVAPDIERQSCTNCGFGLICRRGARLARKNKKRMTEVKS